MKALVCEMCGSQDLVKQDGVYVCQNCGTKYSVEEARKMMVEGTVKVDNTDKLANLYQVARRARDNNDSEGAAKYYDLIQIENPTDWEAGFYSTYFKAMSCKIGEIRSAANSVSNCLDTVIGLVLKHVSGEEEQFRAVNQIVEDCCTIAPLLKRAAESHYNGIGDSIRTNYTQEYLDRACVARDILFTCGDAIDRGFGNKQQIARLAAKPWKKGVEMQKELLVLLTLNSSSSYDDNKKMIESYSSKIDRYDKSYSAAVRKKELQDEIDRQRNFIRTKSTEAPRPYSWILAIACAVIGSIIVNENPNRGMGNVMGFVFVFTGLAFAVLSFAKARKNKQNVAYVAAAKERLAKLEQELKSLDNEAGK